MARSKLLVWLLLAVVALVVASIAIWVVSAVVSFVWSLIQTAVALAVLLGVLYGGYRLYSWLGDDSTSEPSLDSGYARQPENRVENLQQQYASGDLSEAELERQLERELVEDEFDSIDRELQRERN